MGDSQYCKDCKFWNGDWISPVRRLCTHPLTSGDFVTGLYYWCFYFDSRPNQYDELFPRKPDRKLQEV